jgi:hypothetical protein
MIQKLYLIVFIYLIVQSANGSSIGLEKEADSKKLQYDHQNFPSQISTIPTRLPLPFNTNKPKLIIR